MSGDRAWIIIAVAVIATAPALPTTSNEARFLPSSYESIKAQNLQDQAFPQAGKVDAVAMTNDVVNGSGTQPADAIKVLRADIKPLVSGAGLDEGITGSAAQQLDSQQSGNKAEQVLLLATLILILVLLLVIFRSPIIALMPIITIAIVAEVAQGLIADVNSALNLNANSRTTVILIVVLFGIGTGYILFLMFRYRERLRAGDAPRRWRWRWRSRSRSRSWPRSP